MTRHARISDSDKLDRYYTPPWATEALLQSSVWRVPPRRPYVMFGDDCHHIAEPCAGQGHIVDVLADHGYQVTAGDLDPDSPYPRVDATEPAELSDQYGTCDAVVTNPPYAAATGRASDVVRACLTLGVPVACLLRVTWLEPCSDRVDLVPGGKRGPRWQLTLPRVHYKGPGGGKGNPATSVWLVWEPGYSGPCETHLVTPAGVEELRGQPALL